MATKSLGHLALACRVVLSSSAACDITTANGGSSACDFAQFNAVVDYVEADTNPINVEQSTTIRTYYASQGTRHAARIATAETNYSWSDEGGGRIVELGTKVDDTIPVTGVGAGTDTVNLTYNDGGYNDTATPAVQIEVT